MPKRKRGQKPMPKLTTKAQTQNKLKFSYVPRLMPFKVADQIRSAPPRWSLHDIPNEILVAIFRQLGTAEHVMLSLCSKRLTQVSMDLTDPPRLPSRHSLTYNTYKEHMEILVRLRMAVPEDFDICWYCGLYVRRTKEWESGKVLRRVKSWDGGTIRADFCPSCAGLSPKSRTRLALFFMLSWRKNDKRETKNWHNSRQVDRLVFPRSGVSQ